MGSAYQVQTGIFDDPSNAECNEPGITYLDGFIHNHRELFAAFETNLKWNCQFQSRKTVTFGVSYNYRNGRVKKKPMPDFLEPILQRIHDRFGYLPNNCLVNYYPTGDNYISFHADETTEMKADTGVAIISLGSVRTTEARLERLRQLELSEVQLARLHAPVGLPIGSKTPMEIAIAILAELTQLRWTRRQAAQG